MYLLPLIPFLIVACKKVINIDLKNAASQVVIQGNITDAPGPYVVKISKTVNFSATNTYPPVTNATVRITDSTAGITNVLHQVDSGVYITKNLVGVPHHTYGLQVTIDGQQYTASSTMPTRVPLDSITFAENVGFNNQQQVNAVVNFQDPKGQANYYQFQEVLDGRLIPDIFVFEDRLSDGRYIQEPLYNDSAYLQRGDTLQLTMNCVDKNVYNYYFTLITVAGNNNFQSVTPTNPVTNISNGALGYFSAHTTQQGTLVIY
jgi:hypothetical protein